MSPAVEKRVLNLWMRGNTPRMVVTSVRKFDGVQLTWAQVHAMFVDYSWRF